MLADFGNATGDSDFDGPLHQILAVQLDHSPRLSLLPDVRVRQTLGMMGRPANTELTPDVAAEICERTASSAVVEGSIASLGGEYALSLRARNCRTGEILDQEQARAARREDVFKALAQMAKRFACPGCRIASARGKASPVCRPRSRTPSLEAWRSYSAAMKAMQARAQSAETISLLKRAIEIDPAFAMAYALPGPAAFRPREPETGAQNIATAYELRDSVSDCENYFITFNYHRQVTRNLELARQTLESWKHKVPERPLSSWIPVGLRLAGVGSLRDSRRRRSKGDRARSGFCHRLRERGVGVRLSEPSVRSRGAASEGRGT